MIHKDGWDVNNKMGFDNKVHKDSYWMLMQNWGECTVACGGGTKTR